LNLLVCLCRRHQLVRWA
jgi:hypothetical protein